MGCYIQFVRLYFSFRIHLEFIRLALGGRRFQHLEDSHHPRTYNINNNTTPIDAIFFLKDSVAPGYAWIAPANVYLYVTTIFITGRNFFEFTHTLLS